MAQPQAPPPAFQMWQQVNSPDTYMPPAKRQRLSPGPMSPYPSVTQTQTPYAPSPVYNNITLPNAYPPQISINGTPFQTPRTSGVMGPPQRPAEKVAEKAGAEKHLDINDLSDSVISSGIDLREEENLLAASYRTDRNNLGQAPRNGIQQNGFEILSQSTFQGFDAKVGFGPWAEPKQTAEEELYAKHKKAARAFSEGHQHHLDDPFLWGACLRRHLDKAASESGIRLPVEGLFDRIQDKPQNVSGTSMRGSDGFGVMAVQAPSILNRNTPLEGVLSLLSLATNERLRTLLEDAYGLARGRQTGSDGVVPPEWSDLAIGNKPERTQVVPLTVSNTAWDQPHNASDISTAKDSPAQPPQPQTTTSFNPTANPLSRALASIARRERQAEDARIKRRSERRAKKAAAAAAGLSPLAPSSAGGTPLAPGMLGQVAPEIKMTKKERERLAKQDVTEEVQTRMTNVTATMQLGGKNYSWMTGAKKAGGGTGMVGSRLAVGGGTMGISASSNTAGTNANAASTDSAGGTKDRKFGEWREDGIGGKGVQLRDWVCALEADGRDRKTLNFAMAKLGRERTGDMSIPGSAT